MVSFSCENCGDVLTKKKLDPHRNRCRGATFTCIDCMVYFPGTEYRSHTSCMTEDQKYQGALYKPKKQKNKARASTQSETMAHHAYVEDVAEGYEDYLEYEMDPEDDGRSIADMPPQAPTPPSAVDANGNVNVFDFLVAPTPNASTTQLQLPPDPTPLGGGRQLVRFDQDEDAYVDPNGYMVADEDTVQYAADPVLYTSYETPVPKAHKKKAKEGTRDVKKDKKRKRLHVETSPQALQQHLGDEVMTDAPPVLHSGLTGGLNRMMRPSQFPPSPDLSGGDAEDKSPLSPILKTKHAKATKIHRSGGNNFKALIPGTSKSKVSKKRKHSSEKKEKKEKKRRQSHRSSPGDKSPKLIEYRAKSGNEKAGESGALVVWKPRSDLFLSFCSKGPESERGCSMNKALKRFHRERETSENCLPKVKEEKELWRSLRMRRNDRGEVVLFSIDDE
ncbi:hypothetical protein F4780DRAFT_527081 [Xylariomycetidae sp. FL0641]|nr:hypothetical protein F4780DRAFT_527081 [Xylariomycetidae sp. FL0641]